MKDEELRKMLKELFSDYPCLTCKNPDLVCIRWQRTARKFLEDVEK